MNKSKRQSFSNVAISDRNRWDYLAGEKLEQKLRSWLSPPDPWKNFNIACKSRHRGSATWFIQGKQFSEWKACEARGSLLWVHGNRPLTPIFIRFAETENFLL
jgi:hypothetical protein